MKKSKIILLAGLFILFMSCNRQQEETHECCEPSDSLSENLKRTDDENGASLYLMSGEWITENNVPFSLEQLKGKIQVVSMIFSHCEYACPRLVADMQLIEEKIPKDKRDQVSFLLVSFDVERDNPRRLKEFKAKEQLGDNWTLLHGDESEVRMLSVLLDIKYEKQSDGNFAHSNIITVLDKNGVIQSHVEGLGADPEKSLLVINKLLN